MNNMSDETIEIDGQRYLIPTILVNGKLVPAPERKIKLPIEIHENFHINRSTYQPKISIMKRLLNLFNKQK